MKLAVFYRFLNCCCYQLSYCFVWSVSVNRRHVLQQAYSRVSIIRSQRGLFPVRTALVTTFHDTVNYCFNFVLETMGSSVRDVVYERLEKRGIPASDVSTRFDDVVDALNESFGESARVIIYKTVVELCQQYSMHVDFTYQDSLKEHLALLRERVVTDHLVPKRAQREDEPLSYRVPLMQSSAQSPQHRRA